MLRAFVSDESGSVVIVYGAFAAVTTLAIVGIAGMVGSVLDHSYSAVPDEAIQVVPSIEGLSQVSGYLDRYGLGDVISLAGGGR